MSSIDSVTCTDGTRHYGSAADAMTVAGDETGSPLDVRLSASCGFWHVGR